MGNEHAYNFRSKIFLRESDLGSLQDDHADKNLEESERGSGKEWSTCAGISENGVTPSYSSFSCSSHS
jgi:hypothetical protein